MSIRELHWFRFACDCCSSDDKEGLRCFGDRTSWGTSVDDAARKLIKNGWEITHPLDGCLVEMEASGVRVACPTYVDQQATAVQE